MLNNQMLESGDRFVAIFRDAIPMTIRFHELRCNDILLLNCIKNGSHEEIFVSYHNAEQSGNDWFIHDIHMNAIFAEDCDQVCKFDCGETPEYILSAMIKLINATLIQCDNTNARSSLENMGCNEQVLRKIGFGFLFDHVGI